MKPSKMRSLNCRTMLTAAILMCVSVVGASVNSTELLGSGSRMAWLRALLDHHDWAPLLANDTLDLTPQCASELKQYLTALNDGQIWASKTDFQRVWPILPNLGRDPCPSGGDAMCCELVLQRKEEPLNSSIYKPSVYDASGQYTPNVLFGSDYWLGSLNACRDLQLTRYYAQTPPFPAAFYIAKINLTVDRDHLPQSRLMLVGECVPASCVVADLEALLATAEAAATARASATGIDASFRTIHLRPVPGDYNLFADLKFQILGSAVLLVLMLMLAGSLYEGYLERSYRLVHGDNDHDPKSLNNNVPQKDGKSSEDNKEKDLRRETRGLWAEMLMSFSILTNGRTILCTDQPSDEALTCLHGIRFMSVVWVIMVHTYLTVFYVADNKTMRVVTERNFMYQSVGNASYCVDSFFFISGLLVTILFLRTEEKKLLKKSDKKKQNDKQDINKNVNGYTNSALSVSVISQQSFCEDLIEKPKERGYSRGEIFRMAKSFSVLLLYRVIRLTPAYAFVIGLNEVALRYTHYNSVFDSAVADHVTCAHYWWRNLLYINNLFTQREMCMVWSWYMANDTQFYVVGIMLLLISVKHPKVSMGLLGVVMASSWTTTIYISVWHQYKARIQEPFEMFDPLYDKPWSRIGPYLVGMMVGWYLHKTKCQVRLPYWLVALGWPCAIALIASLIFGMVDGYFEVWPTAFYVSIGHTAWGVALAWVTIACCCGYGGLANSALSYQGVLPLSRLTYCAYLVHPTIMMYTSALLDGPLHMQNSMVLTIYAGYAVMAFLASFAISLAFEAPAVRLLKIISGGHHRQRQ